MAGLPQENDALFNNFSDMPQIECHSPLNKRILPVKCSRFLHLCPRAFAKSRTGEKPEHPASGVLKGFVAHER